MAKQTEITASQMDRLIVASAVASGIKDVETLIDIDWALIERDVKGSVINAHQVIRDLKERRPGLFHKHVTEMTNKEYEERRKAVSGVSRTPKLI